MKQILSIFLLLPTLFLLPARTEIIQNRANPSTLTGKKPGRALQLTEVKRITDYDNDFVFKRIRSIKVADDGSIFIRGNIQILKFTPDGKYINNFIKRGEGPGEVKYLSNFILSRNNILVGSIMPVKIISFSQNGRMLNEKTIQELSRFSSLIEHFNGRSYFVSGESLIDSQKSGVIRRENKLTYIDQSGKVNKMNLSFNTKDLMLKKSSKDGVYISLDELTFFLQTFDKEKYFYISHKESYGIVQIDLESGKIIREFSRKYKPVSYVKRKYTKKEDIELYSLYEKERYNDIYKLAAYKKYLLAFTSTLNKNGEILIDVFNDKGKYIDNFYLKIPGVKRPDDLIRKPALFYNGFLWTTDTDEDDIPYAVKFKIENL